jgi:hypothetical protein
MTTHANGNGVVIETAKVYRVSYRGWNRRYFRKTVALQRLAIRMARGKERWREYFSYQDQRYWDTEIYLKRLAVRFARRFSSCVVSESIQ